MPYRSIAILLIVLASALAPGASYAETRVALVIGNAAYVNTPALSNPGNDSEDVARALTAAGFRVTLKHDLTKTAFDATLAAFAREAEHADAALIYYAGHGLQHAGANYVMPVDAALQDEISLRYEMVSVDDLKAALADAPGVKILVLDSCRDNPLADRLTRASSSSSRGLGLSRGLAPVAATQGMVVVYATQAGEVAKDGQGRNSPFASAFVEELGVPGMEVATLFRRVEQKVFSATDGAQSPELSISGVPEFYLTEAKAAPQPAAAPAGGDPMEAEFWRSAEKGGALADYASYLKTYPHGLFAPLAIDRIAALSASPAPEPSAKPAPAAAKTANIAPEPAPTPASAPARPAVKIARPPVPRETHAPNPRATRQARAPAQPDAGRPEQSDGCPPHLYAHVFPSASGFRCMPYP